MTSTDRLGTALAGRYQIERQLGQGGMATVYLAEDLKHKRKVALKVLRPELAAVLGGERFVQEITTTASLQHPHILPLFDSGDASGFLFYVMPYVEGETLRDKLSRETQLDIADAVRITREVADALDYAHRQGVIHRDIKPENILLHDGRPVVADFGIALALSAAAGGRMTETGMSLGTPHYMSPEQATADKDLTARSDIYSLGSVLYEMLTGEPPHMGNSAQAIIMKIVTEEAAPVTRLRKSVPPNVAAAVGKALEKLPADRFESAKAFAEALVNPSFTTATTALQGGIATARPRLSRWGLVAAGLAFLALGVTAIAGWARKAPTPVMRVAMKLPPGQGMPFVPTLRLAIAPDGSRVVYIGPDTAGYQLWVRDLDALSGRSLPGTSGALSPFFSPDGRSVGFFTGNPGDLRVVSTAGGPPLTVVRDSALSWGGSWGEDGNIYFTDANARIARVPAGGGDVTVVGTPDTARGQLEYDWAQVLPGARFALMQIWIGSTGDATYSLLNLKDGTVRPLFTAAYARVLPPDLIVYATSTGAMFAVPVDLDRGELDGPTVPLVDRVQVDQFSSSAQMAFSDNGMMVYLAGTGEGSQQVSWIDRSGRATPVDSAWRGDFQTLSLSPDARQVAVAAVTTDGVQVWIKRLPNGPLSRLSYGGNTNNRPAWSPDGRRVAFISNRDTAHQAFVQRADGGAPATSLAQDGRTVDEIAWMPDGRSYLFRTGSAGAQTRDIWLRRDGDSARTLVAGATADEYAPAASPDGRWLAYVSPESGREQVYVRSLTNADAGRTQVSIDDGTEPRWAHSGRELFYRTRAGNFMVVDVSVQGGELHAGTPRLLFHAPDLASDTYHHAYEVAPDDQRFLVVRQLGGISSDIMLVTNWRATMRTARP